MNKTTNSYAYSMKKKKTEKDFNFHVTRKINIQKQAEPLLEHPKEQQVDTGGVEYKYKHFPKDKSPTLKA